MIIQQTLFSACTGSLDPGKTSDDVCMQAEERTKQAVCDMQQDVSEALLHLQRDSGLLLCLLRLCLEKQ